MFSLPTIYILNPLQLGPDLCGGADASLLFPIAMLID